MGEMISINNLQINCSACRNLDEERYYYYSAIKRNEIELFVVSWMDLESVIQSEVSQKEKNKYHMLTHIYGI